MEIDFELYRHEVLIADNPPVRLSVIDVTPERPLNTIVMLHGYGGNAMQWKYQLRALAATHRCIAFDLRGHGRSDKPLSEYTVDEMIEDLERALEVLRVDERFVLMGHSFGGALATTFAHRYPERVCNLILTATTDRYTLGALERWLLTLPTPLLDAFRPFYSKQLGAPPAVLKRYHAHAVSRWNGHAMMRGLQMPVLIIRGDRDRVFSEVRFDEVARLIPNAEEIVLPATSHMVILERHDAVERAINRFLGLGQSSWRTQDHDATIREKLIAERPWLKAYDEGVPLTIPIPDRPVTTLLTSAARRSGNKPATIFMDSRLTYRQLDRQSERLANALRGIGVDTGTRVMILLPNLPQWIMAFYGVLKAGGVVVSASPVSTTDEILREVQDSQARILITITKFAETARAVSDAVGLDCVIYTNVKDYLGPLRRVVFSLFHEAKGGHQTPQLLRSNEKLWTDLMRSYRANPVAVYPDPSSTALIQYTGGTIDSPKGVMLSHRNLIANAFQTRHWVPNLREGRERVLAVVPFAHVYGMTTAMNVAITLSAAMIILPNFVTQDVLNAIKRHKPTLFPGVPTMYVAINNFPGVRKYGLRSINACISGAAPLPVEVQETFEKLTKGKLVEGYGLTEASPVTHANPINGPQKRGSIGVPLPNTEAKIVHLATGEDCNPGEIGELIVRGPQVMQGYLGRGFETETVLKDGWLYTGDVARMDADGFFQIISRKKEMWYNRRGEEVVAMFPRDLEEIIYEIPEVKEVAVVGIQNFPVAFVTVNRPVDAQTISNYVVRRMPDLAPKFVFFVDEMPKSFIGKILRRHLLEKIPEPQRRELDIVSDRIDEMLDLGTQS
jgi:long-chain acyl-CoA synthetase